jgi:hypothetical protein
MKSTYILAATLFIGIVPGSSIGATGDAQTRQEQVKHSGALVMPFDLARTTHFFDDTETGGTETVTANDKGDREQIDLIRAHLAAEAKRFASGDFSDPARVHGVDMPGLAALSAAGARLSVSYHELPAGASLSFASSDRAVTGAIHEWFAAQRSEHAAHQHMHMHH